MILYSISPPVQGGLAPIYNVVGFVKENLATLPPPRDGGGVKGGPTLLVGPFIADP